MTVAWLLGFLGFVCGGCEGFEQEITMHSEAARSQHPMPEFPMNV